MSPEFEKISRISSVEVVILEKYALTLEYLDHEFVIKILDFKTVR